MGKTGGPAQVPHTEPCAVSLRQGRPGRHRATSFGASPPDQVEGSETAFEQAVLSLLSNCVAVQLILIVFLPPSISPSPIFK